MTRRRNAALGGALGLSLLVAGCTAGPAVTPTAGPDATGTAGSSYRAAWAERPDVALRFVVRPGLSRVDGSERVRFTPDLATCSLVFRLWPNKPETSRAGDSLTVTHALVSGRPAAVRVLRAGAPAGRPGTLAQVALPRCLKAGRPVTARLGFALRLGTDVAERVGRSSRAPMAWFGTAFPLLAWQRGLGWARDPAVPLIGEMATSEDFRVVTTVVAPDGMAVMCTGTADGGPRDVPGPTTVHRFVADAVRDVAVTVGELQVVERTVGGVRVHVGSPSVDRTEPTTWLDQVSVSLPLLVARFGPFPYGDLWVSVVPGWPGLGIEFPGAIQYADIPPARFPQLVPHELAHEWFYGLVGDNQYLHPWLDEAFATYAEALTTGTEQEYLRLDVPPRLTGHVGESMGYWSTLGPTRDRDYGRGVYWAGCRALLEARQAVGADAFDAAIRSYVSDNAHTIATPEDVTRALAGLPEAVRILQAAGALPAG